MTVNTADRKVTYAMDGSQTNFVFAYRTLVGFPEYIKAVIKHTTTLVETELTYTAGSPSATEYTVTVNSNGVGGSIDVGDAQSADYEITLYRETSETQESDYSDYNQFPAAQNEDDHDKHTLIDQEQTENQDRTLKYSITASGAAPVLPALAADTFLHTDGTTLDWSAITGTNYAGSINRGADASKAAIPTNGDIYVATDTNLFYVCFTTGTWTNINTDTFSSGTNAAKSATPDVGDFYMAVDTGAIYYCAVDDAWVEFTGGANTGNGTFVDGDLTAGVLTITHSLGLTTNFIVTVNFADNSDEEVFPDMTYLTNTMTADFSNFGTLSGTYKYTWSRK